MHLLFTDKHNYNKTFLYCAIIKLFNNKCVLFILKANELLPNCFYDVS